MDPTRCTLTKNDQFSVLDFPLFYIFSVDIAQNSPRTQELPSKVNTKLRLSTNHKIFKQVQKLGKVHNGLPLRHSRIITSRQVIFSWPENIGLCVFILKRHITCTTDRTNYPGTGFFFRQCYIRSAEWFLQSRVLVSAGSCAICLLNFIFISESDFYFAGDLLVNIYFQVIVSFFPINPLYTIATVFSCPLWAKFLLRFVTVLLQLWYFDTVIGLSPPNIYFHWNYYHEL